MDEGYAFALGMMYCPPQVKSSQLNSRIISPLSPERLCIFINDGVYMLKFKMLKIQQIFVIKTVIIVID